MNSGGRKIGVWIIGAKGGVATTMITGALAIKNGLISTTGLTTEKAEFAKLNLVKLPDIHFGGYDIRQESLYENARRINEATGTLGYQRIEQLKNQLEAVDADIKPGITNNCGESISALINEDLPKNMLSLRDVIAAIQVDIREFSRRHQLDNVVMLNLASTEPFDALQAEGPASQSLKELEKALDDNRAEHFAASTIYAYAAIDMGCPYINFTPSVASGTPAMQQLALEKSVPHMGRDGKTGETMVKSMLGGMFPIRNLKVLSWAGFNILGDRDGEILANPLNKASKIRTKDATLKSILGEDTFTHTAIEYVPSLDDWKTAWDHIHFAGFLDTKMVMQFIWQGCDSILAAPIALDMVRLADFARQKNERGLMPHLAVFFKSPLGVSEHALPKQYMLLEKYVQKHVETERG